MKERKMLVTMVDFLTGETIKREMTASQIFEALRDGFTVVKSE